jgi:hypothetical protein
METLYYLFEKKRNLLYTRERQCNNPVCRIIGILSGVERGINDFLFLSLSAPVVIRVAAGT